MHAFRPRVLVLGLLALLAGGGAQAQAPAGVAAAVNPQATGTPPAELPRILEVGTNLVQNEHLATGPEGQAQLLFRDGSTLTLGPGSDLTIDEFVYNPETKTGKLAMTAALGVFRFVGGRASKDEPVTIKTPTVTVGIRGAVNVTAVDTNGATDTSQLYGAQTTMTSNATGETVSTTKNGFTLSTGGPGQPLVVSRLDVARLNARLARLEGHAGANGGASASPDQSSPAAQGVAGSNSSQSPLATAPGSITTGLSLASIINNTNQFASQTAQTVVTATGAGLTGGRPVLPSGSYAFAFSVGGQFPGVTADAPLLMTTITGTFNGIATTVTDSETTNLTLDAQGVLQAFAKQSTFSTQTSGCPGCSTSSTFQASGVFSGVTVQELGGDSLIQFGRFTGGQIVNTATSGANGTMPLGPVSFHYIFGVPVTLMPTSGQFSYQLLGATSPTYSDGSGVPGKFTGSMSVLFGVNGNQLFPGYSFTGNALGFVVALDATVTMGADGYHLTTIGGLTNLGAQLATPFAPGTIVGGNLIFGVNNSGLFVGFPLVNATTGSRLCASAGCSANLYGFLAGPAAARAGIAYLIFPNNCSGGSCGIPAIQGVAAFRR